MIIPVADPGFSRGGGTNPKGGGRQPIIWPIFPPNCMKMKKFWARGRHASLTPPPLRSATASCRNDRTWWWWLPWYELCNGSSAGQVVTSPRMCLLVEYVKVSVCGGDTTWTADEPLHNPYRGSRRRQVRSIDTTTCTYLWTLKSVHWRHFPAMCECLCSGHAQWDTGCHVIRIWSCWSKISGGSCNWRSSLQKWMCEKNQYKNRIIESTKKT